MIEKNKRYSVNYFISLALLIICIAFAIAVLFTLLIQNVTLPYMNIEFPKVKIGFLYFFKDGWSYIAELGSRGISNDTINLIGFQLIIMIISFLISAIIIIYVLIDAIRLFVGSKEINIKKSFSLVSASTLQYFFLINIINGVKVTDKTPIIDNSSHFAIGTILMIVSFAFGLTSSILNESRNKKEILVPENLFVLNSIIVVLMIILFGSNKIYSYTNGERTFSSSIYYFFTYNSGRNMSDNFKNYSIAAMIFTLVSTLFLFLSYYKFLNLRKNKKEKSLIVLLSLFLVSSFLSVILTRFALKNYLEETGEEFVKFGSGAFITFVFATLLLISGIIAILFKNNIIKLKDQNTKKE